MSNIITNNIEVLERYIKNENGLDIVNSVEGQLSLGHAAHTKDVQIITVFFAEKGDQTRHELKITCSPDASKEMCREIEKAATLALASMSDVKPFVAHSMKNSEVVPAAAPSSFFAKVKDIFTRSSAPTAFDEPNYEEDFVTERAPDDSGIEA